MTTFDQRGQQVTGNQFNVGGEIIDSNLDPYLAVKLCKALGIKSISSKGDGWIIANVPCRMEKCGGLMILRNVNMYYTMDTVNNETGEVTDTQLIISET